MHRQRGNKKGEGKSSSAPSKKPPSSSSSSSASSARVESAAVAEKEDENKKVKLRRIKDTYDLIRWSNPCDRDLSQVSGRKRETMKVK